MPPDRTPWTHDFIRSHNLVMTSTDQARSCQDQINPKGLISREVGSWTIYHVSVDSGSLTQVTTWTHSLDSVAVHLTAPVFVLT